MNSNYPSAKSDKIIFFNAVYDFCVIFILHAFRFFYNFLKAIFQAKYLLFVRKKFLMPKNLLHSLTNKEGFLNFFISFHDVYIRGSVEGNTIDVLALACTIRINDLLLNILIHENAYKRLMIEKVHVY